MESFLEKKLSRFIVKKYKLEVKCKDPLCGFILRFFVVDCIACIVRDAKVVCPICKNDTLEIHIFKGEDCEDDTISFMEGWSKAIEKYSDDLWRMHYVKKNNNGKG